VTCLIPWRTKPELVGIDFETVNPWGTSRYCPRCGENGRTVKAPDDYTEQRHGGHFHCPECGYECARSDAVPESQTGAASGVQSATDQQDTASGRQTQLSQHCSSSLTVKRRETDTGGLHTNHGSNTGQQSPNGSVTQYVLASTTDCG
jgi:putative transposase